MPVVAAAPPPKPKGPNGIQYRTGSDWACAANPVRHKIIATMAGPHFPENVDIRAPLIRARQLYDAHVSETSTPASDVAATRNRLIVVALD
jgi:hypothetical protein